MSSTGLSRTTPPAYGPSGDMIYVFTGLQHCLVLIPSACEKRTPLLCDFTVSRLGKALGRLPVDGCLERQQHPIHCRCNHKGYVPLVVLSGDGNLL